jgi:hypothetical protein
VSNQDGQETSVATQTERKVTVTVTVENDLVSQAKDEEEDMEALLDTYEPVVPYIEFSPPIHTEVLKPSYFLSY